MKQRDTKLPFDIDRVMELIASAVEPYPKAALFELAERGHTTAFEQLVACIISIRTLDETTLPVASGLFAHARTPEAVAGMDEEEIDRLIDPCTYHRQKAGTIREIARQVVEVHGGALPCDRDLLLGLRGVGPKCANLTLGIACGVPVISVDIHVHRITNRWGYVSATTPERTLAALEKVLPERYHVEINRILVPFGKHICTGQAPKCSVCPVLSYCAQVGVGRHR